MRGHSFSSAGLSLKEKKKKSFQSSAFSCPKNVSRDLTPSVQVHHILWRRKKSNISCLDVTGIENDSYRGVGKGYKEE